MARFSIRRALARRPPLHRESDPPERLLRIEETKLQKSNQPIAATNALIYYGDSWRLFA